MTLIDDYVAAVWAKDVRTLVNGSPGTPTNAAEVIAKGIWENPTRTLTTGAADTTNFFQFFD